MIGLVYTMPPLIHQNIERKRKEEKKDAGNTGRNFLEMP